MRLINVAFIANLHAKKIIEEASQNEEESPSPHINPINESAVKLDSIQEEMCQYVFKKSIWEKEKAIMGYLDSLEITQVYPDQINTIKLSYSSKSKKPLVPKLSLGMNSLLKKRQSTKYVPINKLV